MSSKFEALPYPSWADECHHVVLHRGETFTVGAGGTQPSTSCSIHKHTKPTCAVSTIDTDVFNVIQLTPPEFDMATAKHYTSSFSKGDCFTQAFPDTRLAHSFGSTNSAGAFFAAELNVRVLETEAPCASIHGNGVKVLKTQQDRFWATQLMYLEPGAQATVCHNSSSGNAAVDPLGTLVLRLTDSMSEITVEASNQKVMSSTGSCSGHEFETKIIEYQGDVCGNLVIRNNGHAAWTGTLLNIFGKTEP
ncbi:hypothetical protein BWQ96_03450 [Gracilariopsis chorda]|uniref:Uncharacterized protein n=1 Tax=Gracilariopsis chorda TaxID=448386 RepID=A0A2V3IXD0_9FLOR|nr:hypothetical protein BWQ96_03450 [Gracilariopsis chorda]|eukprot:PXF46759.1 hypothetical protein BWQ96_03450 [Gracilariopsis chorda]